MTIKAGSQGKTINAFTVGRMYIFACITPTKPAIPNLGQSLDVAPIHDGISRLTHGAHVTDIPSTIAI
jgi:hypothetical protein